MRVDGNTPPSSTNTNQSPSSSLDREAFMKLLVTQLKNQDPLNPMDPRETITQLSQLTSVEKLATIDAQLQAMHATSIGSAQLQVAALAGKTVSARTDAVDLGAMGGAASSFTFDVAVAKARAIVRDGAGNEVRTYDLGALDAGAHRVSWDGLDGRGNRVPAGTYSVTIEGTTADGKSVTPEQQVRGKVERITYEAGEPKLVLGDTTVSFHQVIAVEP